MAKPPLLDRIRLAHKVFSQGLPWARWAGPRSEVKKNPFMWPAWHEDKPEWHISDYETYCKEGFAENSVIYAALMYKARAAISAPLVAFKGGARKSTIQGPDHPLSKLLCRPNAFQTGPEFHQKNVIYQNLAGNVYIFLNREKPGAFPTDMRSLRPDRVWIVPAGGGLKGYLYVPEGKTPSTGPRTDIVPILPEDMIHIRMPNPLDPLEGMGYGLPPMSALARSADVDNDVTIFLKNFFQSGTMLNTLLTFDVELDDEEINRIQERWSEKYGGVHNWDKIGVLDKTGKVQHLGMTFKDMGFESLDERNESRMVSPLGVPPILLGTRVGLQRSTMSNYSEARIHFWQDTFVPELNLFSEAYKHYLTTEDGAYPAYDLSRVPALQRDTPKLTEAAYRLWSMGVPANQAVYVVGLDVDDIPGGDVGYVPFTVVPAGSTPSTLQQQQAANARTGATPLAGKATKALESWSPEAKATQWKIADLTATAWEGKFKAATDQGFTADEVICFAMIDVLKAQKATPDYEQVQKDLEGYFAGASQLSWSAFFTPAIQGIMGATGQYWATKLGIEFTVENLYASKWFEDYTLHFAQPIAETTSNDLSALLQQAQREGWSISTTKTRLAEVFRQYRQGGVDVSWMTERQPDYRLEMIARTESMRALNAGTFELFTEWKVAAHEWITTMDGRERLTHAGANGQRRPLTEPFLVGGWKMRFPHDPTAPAEEVINCRCTTVPLLVDVTE